MLHMLTENVIRGFCKEKIESLEHWLRRLIDEKLTDAYGDYFAHKGDGNNRIIKKDIVEKLEDRVQREPTRYVRKIDAILLEDAFNIICHPQLYKHFTSALNLAFPNGHAEARTFMCRLLDPRNRLAHSNPICLRQAEQIICYSNDIIESLKEHYGAIGMQNEYNAPTILKFQDSFGNMYFRNQMGEHPGGGVLVNFSKDPKNDLWPGDTLTIEVEVDSAFDSTEYTIIWNCSKGFVEPIPSGPKATINITAQHICLEIYIKCRIISKNDWHRMPSGDDDLLMAVYKVRHR